MLGGVSNPRQLLSAFPCSLRCGRWEALRESPRRQLSQSSVRSGGRGSLAGAARRHAVSIVHQTSDGGKGRSTRFGELQPMDSSPGCYGRAWPACEKGRGEFENNPAGSREGRLLESDLLASVQAFCSR